MDSPKSELYAGFDPVYLYNKYDSELLVLSRKLRGVFHSMQKRRHGTTFGDVEGELMYSLIRETRPNIAFEISPDCGWSTNYILAALTANQHGVLHSFELEPIKHGISTEDVIRGNQHPDWDQSRLVVHIGDALTTVEKVAGQIDFLLIDSCHDDWFSEWYIGNVFPRVKGPVVVQDIAFIDGLERSSEARYVWEWLASQRGGCSLVGSWEDYLASQDLRACFAERRGLRSNSIVLRLPVRDSASLPQFARSPAAMLEQAQTYARQGDCSRADELLSEVARIVLSSPQYVNRHRLLSKSAEIYMQINQPDEAERMLQRALGVALQADLQQRVKALAELGASFCASRRLGYAFQALLLLVFSRRDGLKLAIRAVADWMGGLLQKKRILKFLSKRLKPIRDRLKGGGSDRSAYEERQRVISADYEVCKDQFEQIARAAPAGDPNKIALIIPGWSGVFGFKIEGVLSLALRLRDFRPNIVAFSSNPWGQRYHQLFGNSHFWKFKEFQNSVPIESASEIHAFQQDHPTVSALMAITYHQVDIGRIALSNIITRHKFASFDLTRGETLAEVVDELVKVKKNVLAAEAMIDRVRPTIAFALEKGLSPAAETFGVCVARGIPVVQYTNSQDANGFVLKRFSFDNRHDHPFSLDETTWEKVKKMDWNPALESELLNDLEGSYKSGTWFNRKFLHRGKQIKSADTVRQQLGLNPDKKTAVIFSHVLWDATFFYGESLFQDYETWLLETVRAACANTNVNWVVKLHPDLVWKLRYENYTGELRDLIAMRESVGALPEHVKLVMPDTDISTYSFFEITDYCLTVRGTIGIEMACQGVPVITAGTGRYSNLGFTIDSSTVDEYLSTLAKIQEVPPMSGEQVELARRFALALFKLRPWNVSSFKILRMPIEQIGHPLDHNLAINVDTLANFEAASDIQKFLKWVVSDQRDYLSILI